MKKYIYISLLCAALFITNEAAASQQQAPTNNNILKELGYNSGVDTFCASSNVGWSELRSTQKRTNLIDLYNIYKNSKSLIDFDTLNKGYIIEGIGKEIFGDNSIDNAEKLKAAFKKFFSNSTKINAANVNKMVAIYRFAKARIDAKDAAQNLLKATNDDTTRKAMRAIHQFSLLTLEASNILFTKESFKEIVTKMEKGARPTEQQMMKLGVYSIAKIFEQLSSNAVESSLIKNQKTIIANFVELMSGIDQKRQSKVIGYLMEKTRNKEGLRFTLDNNTFSDNAKSIIEHMSKAMETYPRASTSTSTTS